MNFWEFLDRNIKDILGAIILVGILSLIAFLATHY
jgi:hypothetical protein